MVRDGFLCANPLCLPTPFRNLWEKWLSTRKSDFWVSGVPGCPPFLNTTSLPLPLHVWHPLCTPVVNPTEGPFSYKPGGGGKHSLQHQHFYFSHRPSPLLRGRHLSGSWRGSDLSRSLLGFSHFWPKLTQTWPRIDPKSTPCKVFVRSMLFMRGDGLWLK